MRNSGVIYNPLTGRWIQAGGRTAQRLAQSGGRYRLGVGKGKVQRGGQGDTRSKSKLDLMVDALNTYMRQGVIVPTDLIQAGDLLFTTSDLGTPRWDVAYLTSQAAVDSLLDKIAGSGLLLRPLTQKDIDQLEKQLSSFLLANVYKTERGIPSR